MGKKGSTNKEVMTKTTSASVNTSTYIKKCAEYDQPAFDDYMSKVYYQMMDDIEKYKVYHDIANAFNNSKSFLQNKCKENDTPCCGFMSVVNSTSRDCAENDRSTIGETTDRTDTITNNADYTNSTFESNTLEDTLSKENTLNTLSKEITLNTMSADEEVDKRNELETIAITANNDNTNYTTEREGFSPLPSSTKVTTSPEKPIINTNEDNGALMNNSPTKTSKLTKQPSLNKKLFKGLKKKVF